MSYSSIHSAHSQEGIRGRREDVEAEHAYALVLVRDDDYVGEAKRIAVQLGSDASKAGRLSESCTSLRPGFLPQNMRPGVSCMAISSIAMMSDLCVLCLRTRGILGKTVWNAV